MNTSQWQVRSSRDVARALKELRLLRSLTQEELSELVQVDRSYLSKLETGRTSRLLDHALRILRYLGAEVTITASED